MKVAIGVSKTFPNAFSSASLW